MKKFGILSLILVGAISRNTLANTVQLENIGENTTSGIEYQNENQLRFFEIEKELEELKKEHADLKTKKTKELKLSGFVGTKIEVEQINGDNEETIDGKFKVVLAEGSLRHEDYSDWSLFFLVAKEQLFNNQMWNRSGSNQNTIVELVPRYQRSFANDRGLGALELIYTSESLSNLDAIKLRPSIFYEFTDKFSVNYALLLGREFKGGSNDYKFIESEPGFSYKITNDFGIGFNYFMKWGEVAENNFSERERLAKPYIWKNFENYKLGLSLWAEIGPYQNNEDGTKNNNTKIGLSGNKGISENLTLVGEISYKKEEKTKSNKNLYIPFYMLGIQYRF